MQNLTNRSMDTVHLMLGYFGKQIITPNFNLVMFQCVDLNECLSNPCGSGARCINEYGGFSCECPPGARGDPYTNCGSLDQCQNNPCGLNARCFNDGGSYRCECPQGFEGNPTQQCRGEKLGVRSGLCLIETFCSDVNECLRNPCGSNAECTNTEGSYQVYIIALLFLISIEPIALITLFQCSCKAGLTGDPFTGCSDTDECSAAQGNPCGGNINTSTLGPVLSLIHTIIFQLTPSAETQTQATSATVRQDLPATEMLPARPLRSELSASQTSTAPTTPSV